MSAGVSVVLSLVRHLNLSASVLRHSVSQTLCRCLFLTVLLSLVRGALVSAGVSVVSALVHHASLSAFVLVHSVRRALCRCLFHTVLLFQRECFQASTYLAGVNSTGTCVGYRIATTPCKFPLRLCCR